MLHVTSILFNLKARTLFRFQCLCVRTFLGFCHADVSHRRRTANFSSAEDAIALYLTQ